MNASEAEPSYGGAVARAHEILSNPADFRDCVAVLFDHGGNDGYWIRILGNKNFSDRRVGSLMIAGDRLAYAEMCALKTEPQSTMGKFGRLVSAGKGGK